MSHKLASSLLAVAALGFAQTAAAQTYVWTDGLIVPSKSTYHVVPGAMKIPLTGPAGAKVDAYLSLNGNPPDALTQVQVNSSGPNDLNFFLFPNVFTMTSTLDGAGAGELEIYFGDPDDFGELPIHVMLTATVPGQPHVFIETDQVLVKEQPSQSPTQFQGGGQYRGPCDLVAPNGGPLPWVNGTNYCNTPAGNACLLNPQIDPLGCSLPAGSVLEIEVPMSAYANIDYDCVEDCAGYAADVYFEPLYDALCNTTATWVDFIARPGAFGPPDAVPPICADRFVHVPVPAVRQYCAEWLWMHEPACTPAQENGKFFGSFGTHPNFGLSEGFHFPPSWPDPWDRANGNGAACLDDLNASDECCMDDMRIRYRVDCLKGALDDILVRNPDYLPTAASVFSFMAVKCP